MEQRNKHLQPGASVIVMIDGEREEVTILSARTNIVRSRRRARRAGLIGGWRFSRCTLFGAVTADGEHFPVFPGDIVQVVSSGPPDESLSVSAL
ncbi:MAG: hypothetical protein NW241_10950 [Bacteroidia bacterium]|nr:hypothetical protein [Bacteroidia bacterium]